MIVFSPKLVLVFFKKKFLISFFLLITTSLLANEKDQIIAQLKSLNSLEFTFDQLINEKPIIPKNELDLPSV